MFHLFRWSISCLALFLLSAQSIAQDRSPEKVFGGHLDAVTMGKFVPDGTAVVTASFDQTARLWDIKSGSELRKYTQHTGPILSLAVGGNGTTLVTGGQDNTVRIWDLPLGKPIRVIEGHQKQVNAIALAPSGDSIVSASKDQAIGISSLSDSDHKAITKSGHVAEVLSVTYRNDGKVYASSDTSGRILLWSPYLDQPHGELLSHDGTVTQLKFASNNQQLFSAGDDGVLRMWQLMPALSKRFPLADTPVIDWTVITSQSQAVCLAEGGKAFVLNLSTGDIISEFPKLDFVARAIAHAPNNSWVCIGDESGKAHLLNLDGTPRAVVAAHQGRIHDVAVHPDSIRFATCGADGSVRIWGQPTDDAKPQEPIHAFQTNDNAPVAATSVVFTPDQQHVLCGAEDGKIRQWNITNGELVRTIDAHSESAAKAIRSLSVTPNGQVILSRGDDQTVRSFKASDGAALQVMEHPSRIHDLSISPDSIRVAVACDDGDVRVWELSSGELLQTAQRHAVSAVAVAYFSDGRTIASASRDASMQVAKTSIIRTMPIHDRPTRSMALYGGGSQVLTCDDQRIVMTNTSNGAEVRPYRIVEQDDQNTAVEPAKPVAYREIKPTAVAVRSDNQRVAAGTELGEVFVWNVNNGEAPLLTLDVESAVTALTYSPDNQKLTVATESQSVFVFGPSVPGVQPQIELTPHQTFKTDGVVTDLAFAADNQSVFVSLTNGRIEQWNYAGIAQRRQMNHGGPVYGVAITNDGKLAVSCSTDQTVRVWDTTTGQQKAQMGGHVGAVLAIAISADETFAVTSGADGTIRLWDIVGGRQLKQLTRFDDNMYSVDIHPNGHLVAAAGADQQIHLLDMTTGEEKQTLEGHSDYIHCVRFDASGDRLLSYGYAGHLKIWNMSDGKLSHESRIGRVGNYAQFSHDGRQIMLSNGDGTARVIPTP